MKGLEKEQIYDFLKKASALYHGYIPSSFSGESPVFEDDAVQIVQEEKKPEPEMTAPVQEKAAVNEADAGNESSPRQEADAPTVPESREENPAEQARTKFQTLCDRIFSCRNCVLSSSQTREGGEGVSHPLVMVISDTPEIFGGEAEILLGKMLNAISLDKRVNCFITSTVKCLPPNRRSPMHDEAASCEGFLQAQIHYLNPRFILLMGRFTAQHALRTSKSITELRGKFFDYYDTPALVTYSPQDLLRDQALKAPAWNDLKFLRQAMTEKYPAYADEFLKAQSGRQK